MEGCLDRDGEGYEGSDDRAETPREMKGVMIGTEKDDVRERQETDSGGGERQEGMENGQKHGIWGI